MLICVSVAITHHGLFHVRFSAPSILGLPTKMNESIGGTKPGQTKPFSCFPYPVTFLYMAENTWGFFFSNDFIITWGLLY